MEGAQMTAHHVAEEAQRSPYEDQDRKETEVVHVSGDHVAMMTGALGISLTDQDATLEELAKESVLFPHEVPPLSRARMGRWGLEGVASGARAVALVVVALETPQADRPLEVVRTSRSGVAQSPAQAEATSVAKRISTRKLSMSTVSASHTSSTVVRVKAAARAGVHEADRALDAHIAAQAQVLEAVLSAEIANLGGRHPSGYRALVTQKHRDGEGTTRWFESLKPVGPAVWMGCGL